MVESDRHDGQNIKKEGRMVSQAVKKAGMIIGVFFALQLVFTLMITIAAALPRDAINQHLQESEATPPHYYRL